MRKHVLLILILLLPACNLTSAPPTPTLPPSATPIPLDLIATLTPAPGQATPIASDCAATPATWIAYTVERADTLSLLAEQTDSTVDELMTGNCMDNPDELLIDTVIFLPREPVIDPAGTSEPDAVG